MAAPVIRVVRVAAVLGAFLILGAASRNAYAVATKGLDEPTFPALSGRVILDNERVLVKAYELQPGQSTGHHAHPAAEVLVYVKGGTMQSTRDGRKTLWRDGRVVWLDAAADADADSRNVGDTVIKFMEVIVKPRTVVSPARTDFGYLNYPNIVGEDILENDHVIVQRFGMRPGQWEGVHAHHPNTLYIFIKGGRWLSKTTNPPSEQRGNSPDGDVGWMAPVGIEAGHQSGNVGTTTSDVVWIALKD